MVKEDIPTIFMMELILVSLEVVLWVQPEIFIAAKAITVGI